MLRIKQGIDLKELEKYGFKPKYNPENREIEEYIIDDKSFYGHRYAKICKRDNIDKYMISLYSLFHIKKYQKWELILGRYLGSWFDEWQFDLLYDLIKDGIVEKIDD